LKGQKKVRFVGAFRYLARGGLGRLTVRPGGEEEEAMAETMGADTGLQILQAVQGLGVRMEALEVRMEALEVRMDKVEARMEALEVRIEKVEEQVRDLGVRMEKVEAQVRDLGVRMGKVEAQVRDLGVRMGKVEAQVRDLGVRMGKVEEQVRSLFVRMDKVEAQVNGLGTQTVEQQMWLERLVGEFFKSRDELRGQDQQVRTELSAGVRQAHARITQTNGTVVLMASVLRRPTELGEELEKRLRELETH
jgi:predicted  nucleic acid-binding Zn-ribbon protein